MYEQVFGFTEHPFTTTPYVKHYFAGKAIGNSLSQTIRCIERGAGPVIVFGGPGTGKSLLLTMIAEKYQETFNVVNLACARLDQRSDLLQNILFELDQPYRDMCEGELRLGLIDYLKPSEKCPNGVLLLVDEAHSLSEGLLEEVRLITNFVRNGQPRVRLVMAGDHGLESALANTKLESFNQRIAARCYLENLPYEEMQAYVEAHLVRAGRSPNEAEPLFRDDAYEVIFENSDGCPRLVNQLCEQALVVAATHGLKQIGKNCVKQAWCDLQSIPGDWVSTGPADQATTETVKQDEQWTVLEFGVLDDESGAGSNDADEVNAFQIATAEEHDEFAAGQHAEPTEIDAPQLDPLHGIEDSIEFVSKSEYSVENEFEPELDRHNFQTPGDAADETADLSVTGFVGAVEIPDMDYRPSEEPSNYVEPIGSTDGSVIDGTTQQSADAETAFEWERPDLDSIEESLPENVAPTSTAVFENPFDEEYEEEEFLADQYLPLVAEQNRNSLNVTSSELSALQVPAKSISFEELQSDLLGGAFAGQEPRETQGPETSETSFDTAEQEFCETSGEAAAINEHTSEFEPSLTDLAADTPTESANDEFTPTEPEPLASPIQIGEDAFSDEIFSSSSESEETFITVGNDENFETHNNEIADNDGAIQQRAAEILNNLGVSPSEHTDDEEASSVVAFTPAEGFNQDIPSNSDEASQRILSQLSEQEELLSTVLKTGDSETEDEGPASLAIEYPVSQHQDSENTESKDDRDMIIVSRAEQLMMERQEEEIPESLMPAEPSTGRATRMNYQDLFNQLREIPNDQ